jgi:hypothetical protein
MRSALREHLESVLGATRHHPEDPRDMMAGEILVEEVAH